MDTHIKSRLLLGAHMSVAGGFEQAIIKAASIGCTCLQLFTKSNRQWHAKPITKQDTNFQRHKANVEHGSYCSACQLFA